jgi:hypothetical protein
VALIITGRSMSLETWTFLGPTVEIRAWNLTPHSGVWFFANLPSGIRISAPRGLALDSSSCLTLFGPSTSPNPFLVAVSAPFTLQHLSDHQPKQKTIDLSPVMHWYLSFIVSPLSIRICIIFGGKRTRRGSRAR